MSERPMECSQCKKSIAVTYKEIAQGNTQCTEMCSDCPLLSQKLQTDSSIPEQKSQETLECPSCHTNLESVKTSNGLGCPTCYEVFSPHLILELGKLNKIPKEIDPRTQLLHSGKTPAQPLGIPSTSKITALNEALNEALVKENYEQAAHLRDQLKVLLEKGTNDAQ